MRFTINFQKKHFYVLLLVGVLIFGALVVRGFGGSNPSVLGHSAGELIVDSSSITDGSITGADIDNTSVQLRVSGTCPAGQSIRSINVDGSIGACEVDTDTTIADTNTQCDDQNCGTIDIDAIQNTDGTSITISEALSVQGSGGVGGVSSAITLGEVQLRERQSNGATACEFDFG